APVDEQQVSLRVDPQDLEALHGRPDTPHLAGHPDALEHPGGVRGADRARLPHVHRAVRLGAAAEAVALDETLEALALGRGGDVHQLTLREDLAGELLAGLQTLGAADLRDVPGRLDAGRLELAGLRLREPLRADRAERQPGGGVAVLLHRPEAEHP